MEIPVQKEAWRGRAMQDGGVIPVTGFPRFNDGDKAKEGQRAPTIRAWSKNEHLIHHKHSFPGGRLGVIPSKRALSQRFGSSGVVVHDRHGK